MRDGIHKTLQLPKNWKGVFKLCNRPADRKEPARMAAEMALIADCTAAFAGIQLKALKLYRESESMLPGIGLFQGLESSRDLGGNGNPLQEEIFRGMKLADLKTISGKNMLENAIALALSIWGARQQRLMEEHCFKNGGNFSHPTFQAIKNLFLKIDNQQNAKRVLSGNKMDKGIVKKPIDLDEDLR